MLAQAESSTPNCETPTSYLYVSRSWGEYNMCRRTWDGFQVTSHSIRGIQGWWKLPHNWEQTLVPLWKLERSIGGTKCTHCTRLIPTGTRPSMRTKSDRCLFLLSTNARSAENARVFWCKLGVCNGSQVCKGGIITHQLVEWIKDSLLHPSLYSRMCSYHGVLISNPFCGSCHWKTITPLNQYVWQRVAECQRSTIAIVIDSLPCPRRAHIWSNWKQPRTGICICSQETKSQPRWFCLTRTTLLHGPR